MLPELPPAVFQRFPVVPAAPPAAPLPDKFTCGFPVANAPAEPPFADISVMSDPVKDEVPPAFPLAPLVPALIAAPPAPAVIV